MALVLACGGGHLAVAQWLQETFHLTAEDARSRGGYALTSSRSRDYVDVINWLVDTFAME